MPAANLSFFGSRCVLLATITPGSTTQPSGEAAALPGLMSLDWVIICLYALSMLTVGWHYSRRTRSAEDYLLGGRRMNASSVGLSLFATLFSTITYLAIPGEMVKHGPIILCWVVGMPFVYLIVGYLLIPLIIRLPVISAYEILEGRLEVQVRTLASVIFLATRLLWMALIIYLTADKIIRVTFGWPSETVPYVAVLIGLITVIYTSMGGLRAVVITDVVQTFILLGGALLTLIVITVKLGGVSAWWPMQWDSQWGEFHFFPPDFHARLTVVGSLIFMTVWWICTAASDQMAIQRYLATRDAKAARHVFFMTTVVNVMVHSTLGLVGFALLAYYRMHPGMLAPGQDMYKDADTLFPHFIVSGLPPGISGLIVSGLLAAAMSSLSSGVNSSCSVITMDFINRFRPRIMSQKQLVRQMQIIALGVGVVAVAGSYFVSMVRGNIMDQTVKTNHVFVAPLFSLFFMALFVPFATPFGTILGAIYGCGVAVLIAYWDLITGGQPLSFQWIAVASLVVNLVAGCVLSLLPMKGRRPAVVLMVGLLTLLPLMALYVFVILNRG